MGCLPLAVTTYFCLTRCSKRLLVGTDRSAIWRYFVSMRLHLAMLLYSWMQTVGRYRGAQMAIFLALLVDLIYWVKSEWNLRNSAEGAVVRRILHYLPLTKGHLQIRTLFSRIWLSLLQFYSNLVPNRSLDSGFLVTPSGTAKLGSLP